ncbi:sperm acrosome membrane-associated protein 1 isoform X1 [Pezoporus occidentalis]|uniref:sperm acrosome membrane-associated protein 1 isoform X1 n=1 Tax=Pezoporus occidentalis TaxID=407982 RepID=UPI002F915A0D
MNVCKVLSLRLPASTYDLGAPGPASPGRARQPGGRPGARPAVTRPGLPGGAAGRERGGMALRAGGAAGLLALLVLLLLASLASGSGNGTSAKPTEAPSGDANWGLHDTESTKIEYGECTVTCGIGIREVLLTSGCPAAETKCIIGVEECEGPVDCGWGIPISKDPECVKMPCIYIPPENRFKYIWKKLIQNQTAHTLPNDRSTMEVCRGNQSVTYQCETRRKKGSAIASVKYTVHAKTEIQAEEPKRIQTGYSRKKTDAILIFCLVIGIIVAVGVFSAMMLMILHWGVVKSLWKSKSGQSNQEKLTNKRSLHNLE